MRSDGAWACRIVKQIRAAAVGLEVAGDGGLVQQTSALADGKAGAGALRGAQCFAAIESATACLVA